MSSATFTHTLLRSQTHSASGLRFLPIFHLLSGDPMGQACSIARPFEETVRFGPITGAQSSGDSVEWLTQQLSKVASATHGQTDHHRPILLPTPASCFEDANTASACDNTVARTSLCQQEICLEFSDSALVGSAKSAAQRVQLLRSHGFRVAVDMRTSWQSQIDDSMRLLIDTIRIDADMLEESPELVEKVEYAAAGGVIIVAENAHWRDGEYLSEMGVSCAISPRTDA